MKHALSCVLDRTGSAFAAVIRQRCRAEDYPLEPVRVFGERGAWFAEVRWPDGRWLVLAVDHRLAPQPHRGC